MGTTNSKTKNPDEKKNIETCDKPQQEDPQQGAIVALDKPFEITSSQVAFENPEIEIKITDTADIIPTPNYESEYTTQDYNDFPMEDSSPALSEINSNFSTQIFTFDIEFNELDSSRNFRNLIISKIKNEKLTNEDLDYKVLHHLKWLEQRNDDAVNLLSRLYRDSDIRSEGKKNTSMFSGFTDYNLQHIAHNIYKQFNSIATIRKLDVLELNKLDETATLKALSRTKHFLLVFILHKLRQAFSDPFEASKSFFKLVEEVQINKRSEAVSFSFLSPIFSQIDNKSPLEELELVVTYAILLTLKTGDSTPSRIKAIFRNRPRISIKKEEVIERFFKKVFGSDFLTDVIYLNSSTDRFSLVLNTLIKNMCTRKQAIELLYFAIKPFAFYHDQERFKELASHCIPSSISELIEYIEGENTTWEVKITIIISAIKNISNFDHPPYAPFDNEHTNLLGLQTLNNLKR